MCGPQLVEYADFETSTKHTWRLDDRQIYIDQEINQLKIDKYMYEYVHTYVHDIRKYIKHTSVNTGTYVDAYLPTYLHAYSRTKK